VSGYPEAHPDAIVDDPAAMREAYWADIRYLKEKLDAGADFVVTQLFYDTDNFLQWVKDCRSVGIDKPIIPGEGTGWAVPVSCAQECWCVRECRTPRPLHPNLEPLQASCPSWRTAASTA